MKSLLIRTGSGIVLVAVMVAAILCSVETLLALALLIAAVSIHEFLCLSFPLEKGMRGFMSHAPVIFIGWVMIFITYGVVWQGLSHWYYIILLPLPFIDMVGEISRKQSSPMRRMGSRMAALIYIGVPMSLLVAMGALLGGTGYNAGLVLFYVILIWINDVGAYLFGITLGKHRLCERLSPKKSWEGFFGGLICTVLASVFLGPRMTGFENTPFWVWIIFGVVLTLSAVGGDLFESMLKREAGVKDSGNLIPGHGGFLDRFDAMLISLPFVYILLIWIAATS